MKKHSAQAGMPDGMVLLKNLPAESMSMCCTIIAVLQGMAAYPFFRRCFVGGLTVGGIKG